jgi:hypothetical protein
MVQDQDQDQTGTKSRYVIATLKDEVNIASQNFWGLKWKTYGRS